MDIARVRVKHSPAAPFFFFFFYFSVVEAVSASHGSAPEIPTSRLLTPNNQILRFTQVQNCSQATVTGKHDDVAVLMSGTVSCLQGRKAQRAAMEDACWRLCRCACGSGCPVCCVSTKREEEDEDRDWRIWSLVQVGLRTVARKSVHTPWTFPRFVTFRPQT